MAREIQKRIIEQEPSAEVIVEYAPGLTGVIALRKLSKLKQTPYVELLVDGSAQLLTTYLTKTNNDVDLDKDIKIVAPIGYTSMLIMSSHNSKINSTKTLKEQAQIRQLNYGSAGAGSITFSTTAFLGFKLGVEKSMINIPYKGTAHFYNDLISGRLDLASDHIIAGAPLVRANKTVGIAVTGNHRSELLPDVPTLKEQGINDFLLNPWFGVFTNSATDAETLSNIRKILAKSLSKPETIKRYVTLGVVPVTPEQISHSEEWYKHEKELYKQVSKKLSPLVTKE